MAENETDVDRTGSQQQVKGQQPGGRATRGPAIDSGGEQDPQTPWKGEDDHGWAPDAPEGEGAEARVIEANRKAFEPDQHETQQASRADGPVEVDTDAPAPTSISRGGEEYAQQQQEPGREDTGTKGPADRPTGESSIRDSTSVGTDESQTMDEDMPTQPMGDQGG